MLIDGNDIIRNIPEQVAQNTEDIADLNSRVPYEPHFYTKSETDALLAEKADSSDVYTKDEVDTALAAKADANDVYTKAETDSAIALSKKLYVHFISMEDENNKTWVLGFINYDSQAFPTTIGYFKVFMNYMAKAVRFITFNYDNMFVICPSAIYYDNPYIKVIGCSYGDGSGDITSVEPNLRIESATDTVTELDDLVIN